MSKSITQRQSEILSFIQDKIESGYAPTLREISLHFGFSSTHGALCHLRALERKGFIVRESSKSRAIRLVHQESPVKVLKSIWVEFNHNGKISSETLQRVEKFAGDNPDNFLADRS